MESRLSEATPTRPGAHPFGAPAFTNDALFVQGVVLAGPVIASRADDHADEATPFAAAHPSLDGDRSSVSLAPATFDAAQAAKPRSTRALKIGAVLAVALAAASYVRGPIARQVSALASFDQLEAHVASGETPLPTNAPTTYDTAGGSEPAGVDSRTNRSPLHPAQAPHPQTPHVVAPPTDPSAEQGAAGEAPTPAPNANEEDASAPKQDEPGSAIQDQLADALAPPFNVGAAKSALAGSSASASGCSDGNPASARVSVTFARSGRVTSAVVDGSLAGTSVGSCIARVMRVTTVPAYSGEIVTVISRVTLK
jgi:hypothetical protein